jgi:predicted NACHT family NTPase
MSKQIQNLTKSYDQNTVLVSSRPDNEFSGWPSFNVLAINALTLGQACDLVDVLPFDTDMKTKFLKDLRLSLFEEHESFLSNPLLLSIMLLTYGQSADIPNKLNIFYNQAYEALFQRHDALKGAYQRDRSCGLDLQDYAKVFSAFCLQTYDKRLLQFSRSTAIDYIEKAKPILNIAFDSNEILMDALQSICCC